MKIALLGTAVVLGAVAVLALAVTVPAIYVIGPKR